MPSIASTNQTPINQSGSDVLSNASAYQSGGYVTNGDYAYYGSPGYQEPQGVTIADLLGDVRRHYIVVNPVSSATVQSASTTVTLNESWHGSRTDVVIGDMVDWPAPSGPQTFTTTNVHFEPSGPGAGFTWDTVTDIRDMDIGTNPMDAYIPISKPVHEPEPEPECVDVDETEWAELLTES